MKPRSPRVIFLAQDAYTYTDPNETHTPFSYAVWKLHASLLSDPGLTDCVSTVASRSTPSADDFFELVREFEPTLVALSTYIWSIPTFLELAKRIKEHDPSIAVVMGGPSARASVLALHPYRSSVRYLDAVVAGEGEEIIRQLVRRPVSEWSKIPGLLIPHAMGLRSTGEPERVALDDYASPYQLGITPRDHVGYMETFRGCPMSCAFCQWGDARSDRVYSAEYLESHLRGLARADVSQIMALDAGFNLSPRALRNLVAAERSAGVLRAIDIHGHLYPTHVDDTLLELLHLVRRAGLVIGIQSFDEDALRNMSRPFRFDRFINVVEKIRGIAPIELELIIGLPGDNPKAFRKTIERATEIGDIVRLFFPLVLPDALLERASEFNIDFDPVTFRMRSCNGWSEKDLIEEWEYARRLTENAPRHVSGDTMLSFVTDAERAALPSKSVASSTLEPLQAVLHGSGWALGGVRYAERSGFVVEVEGHSGRVALEIDRARSDRPSFVARDGFAYSHIGDLQHESVPAIRALIDHIHRAVNSLPWAPERG